MPIGLSRLQHEGHDHFITFSCYERKPYLSDDHSKHIIVSQLETLRERHNFLVYGWNDIVDFETDRHNPRKDTFLFGARGTREQLDSLPLPVALVQLPFLSAFIWLRNWPIALVIAGLAASRLS